MSHTSELSRRRFLQNLAMGAGGMLLLGNYGFIFASSNPIQGIKAIVVDFDKCAGCRTCETVCSAFNHKVEINDQMINGLGNPDLSNIKVWHYNPDVDVPVNCFLCDDAPCIEVCPVDPDPLTGRKALYRDEEFQTIRNDIERCIGCEKCARVCADERGGVIFPNKDTRMPERMCTLCDGDPQCVKYCPYGALQYLTITDGLPLRNRQPKEIAEELIKKYYQ